MRVASNDGLAIRAFANEITQLMHARHICVHVDKTTKDSGCDVFERAWTVLIQRFSNALACGDLPRGTGIGEKGMIVRDSADSYYIQVADVIAFLLCQEVAPSACLRKTGGRTCFRRRAPLLLTQASSRATHGAS